MQKMNKRIISVSEAIFEATDQYLKKSKNFLVIGEGVNDPKGIFGTTLGLSKKYGQDRVIESPISENGITGISIGLSLTGFKVLLVHQRAEFALLSIEQIFNNAAKSLYVTNGKHNIPIVIRLIIGRGWGQGPAHSQSLETIFSYIPGLKVIIPSDPYDAKGMLVSSIIDPNPVIMLEHRWIHNLRGHVPKKLYSSAIDSQRIFSRGNDLTIVANSYNIYECLLCSEILKKFDINLEIVDLRVLRPLNLDVIIKSIRKTGKLIIIETGHKLFGIGAEIISSIYEKYHSLLKIPPSRIGLPESPTPSSRSLSGIYYPNSISIMKEIVKQLSLNREIQKKINYFLKKYQAIEKDVPNPEFKGPF